MNSSMIFAIIEEIAATSSKNEKQAKVSAAAKDAQFVRVLEYTYNPFKTYGVRKIPSFTKDHLEKDFDDQTWIILDALIDRSLTGTAALDAIAGELHYLNDASAALFIRIIRKDLRAGFSESTINKAIKGLIPDFPYMRCSLPKDTDLTKWPWSQGVFSQEKADGMFANVDHEASGLVRITSRQGSEFPIEKFGALEGEVRKRLACGSQNHGEIIVKRDNEVLERQIGNGMLNSVLNGGDFEERCYPVFYVWDQIPLEQVVTKGKYAVPYRNRFLTILKQLSSSPGAFVMPIPSKFVLSMSDAYAHAAELMKAGKEGAVIKHPGATWKDGTSKEQVKIKLEFEVDLEVAAIVPGRAGTKNEGRAGSLSCVTSDGKLRVDVTVKNEAMRAKVDAAPDDWVGRIIAVVANDILEPSESNEFHSLFLPRMVEAGYRTDKTEADNLRRVIAQKEAAIFGQELKEAA